MNEAHSPLTHTPPAFAGYIGAARRDVTPPIGIYNRMWGAAAHDTATGVHRPITATALALGATAHDTPLLLISLDWCHVGHDGDLAMLREPLVELTGGDEARVIIACTHTHGVGLINSSRTDQPGGHLIPEYLAAARDALCDAAREAIDMASRTPATLTWTTGRCALAANRDLRDPDAARDRYLVGYNPDSPADDTLLVGRITRDVDDQPLATIVNYACHPTTLAWENTKLSPDYIGALRESVERATDHAPLLFLQGASGELAPPHQYVGDTKVADQHGRTLGYAVLGALNGMLPPRQCLAHERTVESGAPLAVWRPRGFEPSTRMQAVRVDIELPLKSLPTLDEIDRDLAACADRAAAERLRRKRAIVEKVGSGASAAMPVWLWRVGGALFVAHRNEAYSQLQTSLRQAFPELATPVMNVANGSCGYLAPAHLADYEIYPMWVSPFAAGCLEQMIEQTRDAIHANGLADADVSSPASPR